MTKPDIKKINEEKGRFIPEAIYKVLKAKRVCERCKKSFNTSLEIHHIIPLSRGGTNKRGNLMVLCKECHIILDNKVMWNKRGYRK